MIWFSVLSFDVFRCEFRFKQDVFGKIANAAVTSTPEVNFLIHGDLGLD